jgi:hypothetical protein
VTPPSGARAFLPFALRDAAVVTATLALIVLDARAGRSSLVLGLATGAAVVLSGFFAHEWGHLVGAMSSGATVHAPARLASIFLFSFDTGRSTRGQFLAMSIGGYLASIVAMTAILAWADLGTASGLSAVVLAGLGIAVTFALEIPTTVRVWRGAPMPGHGGVYVDERP